MKKINELKVEDIIFRDDLYPRLETSVTTVQKYAADLSVLPPVEVNQRNELIDGWHRWTAHKKEKAETIKVKVTETKSDAHYLELAVERNSAHGLQLSQEDKRNMARFIYNATPVKEREKEKKELAKILSVSERTVRDWLSRIDKDSKEARSQKIFELWLACHTQEEIAEIVGLSQPRTNEVLSGMAELPKPAKPAADHLTDFQIPIYNVWKFKEKTPGNTHFGNTDITILDNLLYLYTNPFDIVVDPFAGGGSTIDICKKRFRRYWVSDRKVEPELTNIVREADVTNGPPKLPRWQDVRLVYLDPPYWKQDERRYSEDKQDLANMPLDEFIKTLSKLINLFAKKMKSGYIALIIQPTQWHAPKRQYTDHMVDIIRRVTVPIDMRIQCPYESQHCNAEMVEWAKENKNILVLSRELIIWKVG